MHFRHFFLATFYGFALVTLPACSDDSGPTKEQKEIVQTESQKLNDWFAARFEDQITRSPMTASYLGMDGPTDRLDDTSALAIAETAAISESWLNELRKEFDPDRLDEQTKLSYRLFEYATEDELHAHAFSDHDYVFQHMSGPHTSLPSFMVNYHTVETVEDAQNYISRLRGFPAYLGQYVDQAQTQSINGVMLPRFVYSKIRTSAQNITKGQPFTEDGESPLWADISSKVDALDIDETAKDDLKNGARRALLEAVKPAYSNLLDMVDQHEAATSEDDGVWKLPNGADYYQSRLNHYTTSEISADEIHAIGLEEVKRIHAEMNVLKDTIGFKGTLPEFFTYLRTEPEFTFGNDDAGREAYMSQATEVIDEMKGELDALFITKPKADMVVKRVEPFREQSAFGAFYNRPPADGSKPGTYYINLKDMTELPIYQLQSLAYHEGIPGHHMQIAIAQELEGLPKFRTLGGYTPYVEGWALYAESLPGELGLYTDPYQDFGRLSMELFRAVRLVVDTGIHHKKWTRDQAVNYMMENSANSEGDIRAEIDRYIVWPGQATAYKIGMLKIQALRKKSEETLGEKFDIREFHDVILASGAVPLSILEELVDSWIESKD